MKKNFFFLILFAFAVLGKAQSDQLHHIIPPAVLLGERIHLEVTNYNNRLPLDNVALFYHMEGEAAFRSLAMKKQGFTFVADFSSAGLHPGNLEYYFAYQDVNGTVHYLPQADPQNHPFRLQIMPAKRSGTAGRKLMDILLLSPQTNQLLSPDEVVIAFSIPLSVAHPEKLRYKLIISGVDVTRLISRDGHLISFAPPSIRSGLHNAEFSVYNALGKLLGKKDFSFRVSGGPSVKKGFNSATSIFLDNRSQNLAGQSANYFRGGLRFNGSYKKFDLLANILISSEEAYNRQPINRYSLRLRYNFSERYNLYLKGGDFSTYYGPLTFYGKRIRGFGLGLYSKYFNFDFSMGNSNRAVEGKAIADSITQYGTYQQKFIAIRPQFNYGKYFGWALDLINSKDDPGSIKYGGNPKEALVLGTALRMNLDNNRILLKGSFQGSIKNEDATGKIDFDSLAARYDLSQSDRDQAEQFVNLMEKSGFLTLSQGLAPIPSLAMQFEAQFNYFNNSLHATYKNIDPEFTTPGNPYLLKDIRGLFVTDNIRLLNNQVFFNLYYNSFANNLNGDKAKTDNTELGGSISYFPLSNLPSLSLSYGNQERLNNVDTAATSYLMAEDNRIQRFGLSSSYNFKLVHVRNTLSFGASKFIRDDAFYPANRSDFTLYNLGLRNRFTFPLTLRLNYAKSNSGFGEGDLQSSSDIQKYFLGMDYTLRNLIPRSTFKPYLQISYQKISKTTVGVSDDYNRLNYTSGFYFHRAFYGNISLRFDYIDYGKQFKTKDHILSVRYEVNF